MAKVPEVNRAADVVPTLLEHGKVSMPLAEFGSQDHAVNFMELALKVANVKEGSIHCRNGKIYVSTAA